MIRKWFNMKNSTASDNVLNYQQRLRTRTVVDNLVIINGSKTRAASDNMVYNQQRLVIGTAYN
jgi:hypothetical protein